MSTLREAALKLRKQGHSYSIIGSQLGISKSTLSNWLSGVHFVPNKQTLERIGKARLQSGLRKHEEKLKDIAWRNKEAKREIGKISKRDLFMLGVGLYMGEGSKAIEEIRIVNSDPAIIKLGVKWIEESCKIPRSNIMVVVHGYPDNNDIKTKNFWSKVTGIPIKQFGNTIIDSRTNKLEINKRKLPYGTANLCVRVRDTLVPGVKSHHRKIMGWIGSIIKQLT